MSGSTELIHSVTGAISVEALGITQTHEHLGVDLTCYWDPDADPSIAGEPVDEVNLERVRANPFACRDNLRFSADMSFRDLEMFANLGGGCVIDLTGSDEIGRDVASLQALSSKTGVTIIASTGHYLEPTVPTSVRQLAVDELAARLEHELIEGVGNSGVRAGVIGEIGIASSPMSDWERKVLHATLIATSSTGRPVFVHPGHGIESVQEIAELVTSSGGAAHLYVLCHTDVRLIENPAIAVELAAMGFYLGLDTFGRDLYYSSVDVQLPDDSARLDMIDALADAGQLDRVLVSSDICFKHETSEWGGHGMGHILSDIVPHLKRRGYERDQIRMLLADNARRLLSGGDGGGKWD